MATTENPTLLVADDDRDCRQLYRLWFDGDYDVLTAADGAEALEQVDESTDAVLLDREMPAMDGVAVASEIRSGPNDPALVMVSGVEPEGDVLDIEVDAYLTKPVDRADLRSALSRTRSWRQHSRQRRNLLALAARRATVAAVGSGASVPSPNSQMIDMRGE